MKHSAATDVSQRLLDGISGPDYARYLRVLNSTYYFVFHDMRTPVRAIEGFGLIAQEQIGDIRSALSVQAVDNKEQLPFEELQGFLERMVKAASHLMHLFSFYQRACVPEAHEDASIVASPFAAVNSICQLFPATPISIVRGSPQSLQFLFPARVLVGILAELVRNSVRHGHSSTRVRIGWAVIPGFITITVQDTNARVGTKLPQRRVDLAGFAQALKTDLIGSTGLYFVTRVITEAGGLVLFSRSPRLGGLKVSVQIRATRYARAGKILDKESASVD